jgi:hypothetical protein
LAPFGQSNSAGMFKNITAVEVALIVEKVVDGGMDGGDFLEGANVPKPRHRFFPSSEWLVRVFGSIVEPTAAFLVGGVAHHLHRRTV